jgi:hypothetical protein
LAAVKASALPCRWKWRASGLTRELIAGLHLAAKEGVLVEDVAPEGPGDEAGLQPGHVWRDAHASHGIASGHAARSERCARDCPRGAGLVGAESEAAPIVLQVERAGILQYMTLAESAYPEALPKASRFIAASPSPVPAPLREW